MAEALGRTTKRGKAEVEGSLLDRFEGALLGGAAAATWAAEALLAAAEAIVEARAISTPALARRLAGLGAAHPAVRAVPIGLACVRRREALCDAARAATALTHDEPRAIEQATLVAGAIALVCRTGRFVLSYYIDNLLELSAKAGGAEAERIARIPEWIGMRQDRAAREIAGDPVLLALTSFARSPVALPVLAGPGLLLAPGASAEAAAAIVGALSGALSGARAFGLDRRPFAPALRRVAVGLERLALPESVC